jgi:pimeloyl-ACP methyl ester carboxylesterase
MKTATASSDKSQRSTLGRRALLAGAGAGLGLLLMPAAVPAQPMAMGGPPQKTLSVFGANIRYYDLGDRAKPTLVLVHGVGSSAWGDWGAVMPALARSHRVIALDQLGFGKSDKPVISYGIQTWVDTLGEFLRLLKVRDFTLMGESLGGWVSARYTAQALRGEAADPRFALPRPRKLVLCNAAGDKQSMLAVTAMSAKGAPPLSVTGEKLLLGMVFHDPRVATPERLEQNMRGAMLKGDGLAISAVFGNPRLAQEENIDGVLGSIDIPTQVVWGEYDGFFPLEVGKRIAAGIPGARLVVIPDTGHAPMLEKPTVFLAAVGPFIAD